MTIAAKDSLRAPPARPPLLGVDRLRKLGNVLVTLAAISAAVALAPDARAVLPLTTLAAILCFIFLFPKVLGVASHVWGPLLGATVLIVFAHASAALGLEAPNLGWRVVWDEVAGHFEVPVLVLCFAYLSISLDDSGFFNWCSLKLLRAGRGSGRRLIVSLFLGVSVLTFFTSNDIVVLSMTPILIYLGNHAKIRNLVPLLMVQFIAANTASMGLYIGNPTNIVIGNAVGMGFVEYTQRMAVPTLVATFVTLALVLMLFARRGKEASDRYALPLDTPAERWTRQMTIKVTLFAICLVLLCVFGNPWVFGVVLDISDPEALREAVATLIMAVSAGFAVVALVFDLAQDRMRGRPATDARARLGRLPLEIVPFFLSFCLVLRGIEEAGLTRQAVDAVARAFEHGPLIGSLATGFYGVFAVNTMNNIPATILFEKMWLGNALATPPIVGLAHRLPELDPAYGDIFIHDFLFASNFGANLTFIGALAGLMWLKIIRDHASRAPEVRRVPTTRDFLIYGFIIVPIVTVATCVAIAWCAA